MAKIKNINEIKNDLVYDNYEEVKETNLNRFLKQVDEYNQKQLKENKNNIFEEGFKLGLLVGEYQLYFEKLYDLEVLNKELSDDELEFVSFYKIKEEEYFNNVTSLKESDFKNKKEKKIIF